jgi:predicted ferric reductase
MRYTYRIGFSWMLVFILLSLVPMGIALLGERPPFRNFLEELGIAMGLIGLGMMGAQFIFSGRFHWVAPTFGMDNITQYHREIGIVSFLFVLAHPVLMLVADWDYLSFFDPRENLPRAIALSYVTVAIFAIVASSLWRTAFKLSYEKWRLLHGFLALSIVFVGIVHSIQVSHYLDPLWKKIALAATMGGCMYLVLHTRLVRPWINRNYPYRVVKVKPEKDSSWSLSLEADGHERLKFITGQFVWITLGPTPFSLQQHPFTIASSDRDKYITLTAKESGDFTGSWGSIKPGTRAFLEGPFGSFTPEVDKHLFLVMGGIGVTPAMSMLRTMRDTKDPRQAILIYGSSKWKDVTFRDELEELEKEIDLKVVHLLSEPEDDWEGETGFVTEELLKKYLPENPDDFMYFICGPGELMDVTEVSLRKLGIDWRKVYTERFEIV